MNYVFHLHCYSTMEKFARSIANYLHVAFSEMTSKKFFSLEVIMSHLDFVKDDKHLFCRFVYQKSNIFQVCDMQDELYVSNYTDLADNTYYILFPNNEKSWTIHDG